MAAGHHEGQLRRSGEPYITHPLAVAGIVARYGMDDVTIAAALLHDAVEDTRLTLTEIDDVFGPEVTAIVDGVTKLERIKFDSKEAQQAATMRKMLVAMAKDLRVLVIKLADRLHNMRTLAAMPAWKQERTAQETLDIYAPLAHRLGMQEIKQQLEDLCFAALHPKRYAEIDHMVASRTPERDAYLDRGGDRGGAAAQGRRDHRADHRPAEAPLVHLREDDGARQGVRGDLRPRRHPRRRRQLEGLLRRARHGPRHLDPGSRAGSRTTWRCRSSTCTSRCTRP